jgi:hypothetical protein
MVEEHDRCTYRDEIGGGGCGGALQGERKAKVEEESGGSKPSRVCRQGHEH